MGRRRPQAPGNGRAGRFRHGAEDRRLGRLADVRVGPFRARRHPRRRHARRGRDAQLAHGQGDPPSDAQPRRRRAPGRPRGPGGDLPASLRIQAAERAPRRPGQEDRAQPAQCRRRLAPAAQPADHGRARSLDLGLRCRGPRGGRVRKPVGAAPMAARARLPHEPVRGAARERRRGRPCLCGVGVEARSSSTTRSTAS